MIDRLLVFYSPPQVHNTPEGHVTRDYKEGAARLGDTDFTCIDTSGLEPFMAASSLQASPTVLR